MTTISQYDPTDWYWQIAGESGVFSSRARSFVEVTDTGYQAFLNRGDLPTAIAGMAELKSVLQVQYPAGLPVDLPAYAAQKRWELETGGIEVSGMPVDTSRDSQALIHGAFSLAQTDASVSFRFKSGGAFIALDASQMIAIGEAVARHIQACFVWEASILDALNAETISSEADIDAAFAAFSTTN